MRGLGFTRRSSPSEAGPSCIIGVVIVAGGPVVVATSWLTVLRDVLDTGSGCTGNAQAARPAEPASETIPRIAPGPG